MNQVVPGDWRLIHMRDADWETLELYVDGVLGVLRLPEWRVIVSRSSPESDDAMASIQTTYGRKQALLSVSAAFREATPEMARYTIVHELAHLLTDDIKQTAKDLLEDEQWPLLRRREEELVDRIATLVAPHLPFIPWAAAA